MLSQTFHHHLWGLPFLQVWLFMERSGLLSLSFGICPVQTVHPWYENICLVAFEPPKYSHALIFMQCASVYCVVSVQRQTSSVQEWPQPFVMTFNFTGNHYGVITGYDLNLNRLHMWVAEPVLTLTSHWCRISYDWWISELILREALLCRLWRKPVRKWMSKAESSSRTIPSWI